MALLDFNRIRKITNTYRHLGRYQEIVVTFLRHGFSDIFQQLGIDQTLLKGMAALHLRKADADPSKSLSRPERLRVVLEELGPSFIKLGQILSGRPEWLPPDYIEELEKLQDRVPPIPFEEVRQVVESELECTIESFFTSFDPNPLAAASIGQVHSATLQDGREVVVKVQRPRLKRILAVDLEIMHYLATLLEEHLDVARTMEPTRLVEVFRKTIERELDFEWERSHLELFANVFRDDPDLYVPQVMPEGCTKRVLVMERIHGSRPDNPTALAAAGHDLPELARKGARIIMEQIFVHGFYHADPHPGNIFVMEGDRLCYVDYGMVGRISRGECEDLAELAFGVVQKNERRAVKLILRLSEVKGDYDRENLESRVGELFDHHLNMPLGSISIRRLLQQSIEILREHHIVIKPHFVLMLKALGHVEALGRNLDPQFQIVDHLKPFLQRVAMRRYAPRHLQQQLLELGEDILTLGRDLPRDTRELISKATRGELSIHLEHHGLQTLNATLDRTSNRLSFALIVSSLVISSSLIVHARIPPVWAGIPIIGLAGFCLAALMGMILIISMLRNRSV